MFCEKKTNKDFSFKARELVTKAGSRKTWERESLFLKFGRIHSMGRFIYLFYYLNLKKTNKIINTPILKKLLKTVSLCMHVSYSNVFSYNTCITISEGVIIQLMPPTNIP